MVYALATIPLKLVSSLKIYDYLWPNLSYLYPIYFQYIFIDIVHKLQKENMYFTCKVLYIHVVKNDFKELWTIDYISSVFLQDQ